jgi:hypothetical protein
MPECSHDCATELPLVLTNPQTLVLLGAELEQTGLIDDDRPTARRDEFGPSGESVLVS